MNLWSDSSYVYIRQNTPGGIRPYFNSLDIFSEYGSKSSMSLELIFSKTNLKYRSTLTLLILHVWTRENNFDEYLAPAYDPDVWNTFLCITNGLTACSAILFDISTYPLSIKVNKSFQHSLV